MSSQFPELDGLSGWKMRLLERIQHSVALAADLSRIRSADSIHSGRGDPTTHGGSNLADLSALHGYQRELDARAAAAGIPAVAIQRAHEAGQGGRTSPECLDRDAVAGEAATDHLADRIWHLEHSALVLVEYNQRTDTRQIVADLELLRDLERSMTAAWFGATEGIDFAGLSLAEAGDLWDRDTASWQPLAELVRGYDDSGLRRRLHDFTLPEIENTLRRLGGPDEARVDHAVNTGTAPPTPYQLVESATDALHGLDYPSPTRHQGVSPGLDHPEVESASAVQLTWTEAAAPDLETGNCPPTAPDFGPGM
ncbi:hypothetical protein [Nocardia fusca]|uniref:hypothetical protein n=1 Tax=Nocardia fusca TaxID=941183 RepID=UPI0007A764DE|nr:hypothetical protein [Nocardia fusca]